MKNVDTLRSGRYGRRQVWLLTATGLSAGLVTLVVVGITQRHIVAERDRQESMRARLADAISSIDRFRTVKHDQILALLSNRQIVNRRQQLQLSSELRRRVASSLASIRAQDNDLDDELLAGMENAEHAACTIQTVTDRAEDWHFQHTATLKAFNASQARTRNHLHDLRNDISRLEGMQRLKVALKFRQFSRAVTADEAHLAQDVIQAFESQSSFQAWNGEVADLAVFTEQLIASSDADSLANLKDNSIKPSLVRLRQTVPDKQLAANLSAFETSLFGAGFVIDEAHQTIVSGTGGLFSATRSLLDLQKAGRSILDDAESSRVALRAAVQRLESLSAATAHDLAEESGRALRVAWVLILVVGILCVVMFVILATKIARTITQQIDEIADKSKELSHAQKLESIGALAAGIAHEINTPMQFVSDNIEFLDDCSHRLFEVVDAYHNNLVTDSEPKAWGIRWAELVEFIQHSQFTRMRDQIPQAIVESREGIERVIGIVKAMKEFSHPGDEVKVDVDLNNAIQSAVTITRNRWKFAARMALDLDPNLPTVRSIPGEIHQVLLNLIVNASDAIVEKNGEESEELGTIAIRTSHTEYEVTIKVEDSGCGIPDDVRNRVFDPFFTTKDVGKGTGQGLAICYNIVVNKHRGSLDVESRAGVGTTFRVTLPLAAGVDDSALESCDTEELVADESIHLQELAALVDCQH